MMKVVGLLVLLLLVASPVRAQMAVTHTAVNVASTTATALAANADRSMLLLENDSDTVIYCSFGTAAVLNTGIRLGVSGGAVLIDVRPSQKLVACIHGGSGNKVLLITEGTQ